MHDKPQGKTTERWLRRLSLVLPEDRAFWIRAMVAEYEVIDSPSERALWMRGIISTLLRLILRKSFGGERPWSLTAAALYLFGFSAYVFGHTLSQAIHPGIHERWAVAWFPVFACFVVTLFPAAIGFGLWLADDLARKMTCMFVLLDLIIVAAFAHAYGFTGFRALKVFCDTLILAAMLSPSVREVCSWNRPISMFSK